MKRNFLFFYIILISLHFFYIFNIFCIIITPSLRRCITILNIYKKIKIREKLIIIIKLINKDLDKENDFNEKDSKDNILFKTIKLFSNKEPLFDSLNNKELKLPSPPPLRRSQRVPFGEWVSLSPMSCKILINRL